MSLQSPFNSLNWADWLYGLFYGSIGGGANAVYAAFGAAIVDQKDFSFGSAKSFKLMGMVFLFSALMSAFLYLKQKPLPDRVIIKKQTSMTTIDDSGSKITVEQTTEKSSPVKPKDT